MISNSVEGVELGSNSKPFYRNVELNYEMFLGPHCYNLLQGLGQIHLERHTEKK